MNTSMSKKDDDWDTSDSDGTDITQKPRAISPAQLRKIYIKNQTEKVEHKERDEHSKQWFICKIEH